jgi:uncharacterized protein YjbJ (UPF0337 family)
MTTWREDALKGAAIGALVFLGIALIIVVAQWLWYPEPEWRDILRLPYELKLPLDGWFGSNRENRTMNDDRLEGTARNLGGKIEEGLGRATGDLKSQAEGKMNQAAGAAQELYGQARETAGDAAAMVGRQAVGFEKWLHETIETKPYTAVAVALAVGWLIGRMGRSY